MPQPRQVEDRPAKTRQEFMESGLTAQQDAYFLESVVKAKERRQWFQQWDASMPPMIRQRFGIHHGQRRGVRSPLLRSLRRVAARGMPTSLPGE